MGRDPKGVVSSTASGPVDIPPPAPAPPRRRQADILADDLKLVAARLTILETRMDALVRTKDDHDRWFNELQRFMDGTRQRDEWGPRRVWLWCWDVIRRWWAAG